MIQNKDSWLQIAAHWFPEVNVEQVLKMPPRKTAKNGKELKVTWSLPKLMIGLHERVAQDLRLARELIGHSPGKGDASQNVDSEFWEQ